MAGGPIFPNSAYPVTAGSCFPNIYVGGGANSKHEEGMGVAALIAADATWRLRFHFPPTIPTGTAKIRLLALANATSGVAKCTVQNAVVAAEDSPSGATLTSETQASITWGAGDNDQYKEAKVTLTTTPAGNSVLVCDLVFNTTNWTLAQVSTWIATLIWE